MLENAPMPDKLVAPFGAVRRARVPRIPVDSAANRRFRTGLIVGRQGVRQALETGLSCWPRTGRRHSLGLLQRRAGVESQSTRTKPRDCARLRPVGQPNLLIPLNMASIDDR